jgi:hypothetical protein
VYHSVFVSLAEVSGPAGKFYRPHQKMLNNPFILFPRHQRSTPGHALRRVSSRNHDYFSHALN